MSVAASTIQLRIENNYIHLTGFDESDATARRTLNRIDRMTSYVARDYGADGPYETRVHLLRKRRSIDEYLLPVGLLDDLLECIPDALDVVVSDERKLPNFTRRHTFSWHGPSLRPYQEIAVSKFVDELELAMSGEGTPYPRGVLGLPIRSGKTMIGAKIIQEMGFTSLFLVPSDMLLTQTAGVLESCLDIKVGMIGQGVWQPAPVMVGTFQSFTKYPDRAIEIANGCDLLIVDEAHHLRGEKWRKIVLDSKTWCKVGLSATLFEDHDKPQERSAIWIRAAVGPVVYSVPVKHLIDNGWLTPPHILIYEYKHKGASRSWRSGATYTQCIVENEDRNSVIADLAEDCANNHCFRVLIDTGRIKQMQRLHNMLIARGVRAEVIHGKTRPNKRAEILEKFKAQKIDVVIGTVLGEGIDIPELEVVINAEGGKSRIATMQRLRNLTVSEGKTKAIVIDFADTGQRHLQDHASERVELYAETEGFIPIVVPLQRPALLPDISKL